MSDPKRHKVGDVDPEGLKTLHDAMAGKTEAPAKPAPAAAVNASPEELTFVRAMRDLLKKHEDHPMAARSGGAKREETVDSVVNEAVTGAKGANPDY